MNETPPSLQWLTRIDASVILRDLQRSGALADILPEVAALYGVPQNPDHHPEVCTGLHTEMCLDMAARLNASTAAKFAVLVHDLGKALTPEEEWPKHVDHETKGLVPVAAVCDRLAVPAYWRKLALMVCELHLHAHRAFEMRSKSMLKFLSDSGLETDSALLEDFLVACEADKRGRLCKEEKPYLQGQFIREAAARLQGLYMAPGTLISDAASQSLHRARLDAVREAGAPFRQELEAAREHAMAASSGC